MAGKLNVTVECNPLLGPQLAWQLVKDVHGRQAGAPKRVVTEEGCSRRTGGSRNCPTASTEAGRGIELRWCCGPRPVQTLRRHRRAGRRRPQPARRRDPRADGAERRGQIHADQGAHRRRTAAVRADRAGRRVDRARHAAGGAARRHQHRLPGSESLPQSLRGGEPLCRPLSARRWTRADRLRARCSADARGPCSPACIVDIDVRARAWQLSGRRAADGGDCARAGTSRRAC